MNLCIVGGCPNKRFAHGDCNKHYMQKRRAANLPVIPRTKQERFWAKVDDRNGPLWEGTSCWLWTAYIRPDGYGQFSVNGRHVKAHRFAYETYVGPIPEGLEIDHLCRNRACQNWAHMEPVTCQVNLLRGIGPSAVNAAKTHCPQGHEYSPANTRVYRNMRTCRTCDRDRARRYRAQLKLSH